MARSSFSFIFLGVFEKKNCNFTLKASKKSCIIIYKTLEKSCINMLRRKIINKLSEWKEETNNKAHLIKGARQAGKTTIVRHDVR